MTAHTNGPGAPRAGVLELREVTKVYARGARPAVSGLSLTVPAGEVCVLIGPSGCGKTTALKMINRLIEPTSGEILIDGQGVRRRNPAHLRREIGYVIQQVGLMPHLTIAGNVATVPRLLGWDKERIRARVRELLQLIGLDPDEYGKRYPAQLSGGQQQRVGLARALAADPPVMLMDEPFSAVDPITRERLQNDFLRLHRAVPKTVVFVTHDIDEAVKMADRIALMRDGMLVQYATPADLLAHPVDDFVADFVGADRALKSLNLTRLEELDLPAPPAVRVGERVASIRGRIASGDLEPVADSLLVLDEGGKPVDWIGTGDLDELGDAGAVPPPSDGGPGPLLDRLTTLRDALSALFEANSLYGAVVDDDGCAVGVFGVPEITQVFRRPSAVGASGDG
jgi:osmoprotectant transport system ATP-binding protein